MDGWQITLIAWGGGNSPYDAKFSEWCSCLHNNNAALIKQKSLFDTTLVMTKTLSLNSKSDKKLLLTNREVQTETLSILPKYFWCEV